MDQQRTQLQGLFDQMAPTYDHVGVEFFGPIAAGLVAELDPQPGEHALDVGCGRGAVLSRVARTVGSTGSVLGIDFSPAMVEASRSVAEAAGLTHVEIKVMDAQDPDLPTAHFDVIASSLVLFFLPDPARAVSRWVESVRPGGRVGISTFAHWDPGWEQLNAAFDPWLPDQLRQSPTPGTEGPFASDAGVEALFTGAGLTSVSTATAEIVVLFADVSRWEAFTWSTGQRPWWLSVPQEHRADVLKSAASRFEQIAGPDGSVRLSVGVRYTLGVRPAQAVEAAS